MTQGEYHILVKGKLDSNWAEWFDGWTVSANVDGTTLLSKKDADQAALYGILLKTRNLNLALVSVRYIDAEGREFYKDLTGEKK